MDFTWLNAILVGAGCLAFGYFFGSNYPLRFLIATRLRRMSSIVDEKENNKKKKNLKNPLEIENLADVLDDFKMVIPTFFFSLAMMGFNVKIHGFFFSVVFMQVLAVRNDLKMGKGKIAAQCRFVFFKTLESRLNE